MANEYLIYNENLISDFSPESISNMYEQGYIFGRRSKGDMYQTRSVRINLDAFELSSENRRVLKKTDEVHLVVKSLPYENYEWHIHKLAKDFYETKFGKGVMSAAKIKSMFTEPALNNMTHVLEYSITGQAQGYCLCYMNENIMHYCYPFYKLDLANQNMGIGMMTKAIIWAKENGLNHVYLGTAADASAKYKLQFKGLEWWNVETMKWDANVEKLKEILTKDPE